MSGGKLEVQIGADKSDLDKKIKEVEFDLKELSKIKIDQLRLGLDTKEINAQIKDVKSNLNNLKTTVKDTGAQISGQFSKQVGNGSNTLLQFSRIAQDAPFGIIGIGNNLTATAESFGYLKQQTGSTGGALKALASSISGTGGVLLGVSLLTTGLTLLSQSGLSVEDVINKLTGDFDSFGKQLNSIRVEAEKNSGQEIANVKALVSVAQDEVKTRRERLIAVDELQSKYPAYFGNLSKEKILNGDLTLVTKDLTKAIIARAEATAISDKIGELASKKLDLQIQKEKALLKLQQAQANVKGAVTVSGGTLGATGLSNEGQLASATSRVKDLNKDILEIQIQQDKLAGRLNQKTADSILLLEKKEKLTKQEKVFDTPQVTPVQNLLTPAPLVIPAVNTKPFTDSFIGMANTVSIETARMLMLLNEFNAQANDLIVNSITSTFSQLGSSIGTALAEGGNVLNALGKTIIQALGNFLSSMGDLLIQYGTLAIIKGKLDLAIATGGPVSIAAGIAAIAVGVALKAAGSAIGSFATGGGKSATSTGAGANNSNYTSSGFSSRETGGTYVFEIAGTKLIGVLQNTINSNRRLGSTLGLG